MWYSVEALYKTVSQETAGETLYERSIFLIEVRDEQEVPDKAHQVALSLESSYNNAKGGSVKWTFVEILDVQDLCEEELYDGVEVFSRLGWQPDMP